MRSATGDPIGVLWLPDAGHVFYCVDSCVVYCAAIRYGRCNARVFVLVTPIVCSLSNVPELFCYIEVALCINYIIMKV